MKTTKKKTCRYCGSTNPSKNLYCCPKRCGQLPCSFCRVKSADTNVYGAPACEDCALSAALERLTAKGPITEIDR